LPPHQNWQKHVSAPERLAKPQSHTSSTRFHAISSYRRGRHGIAYRRGFVSNRIGPDTDQTGRRCPGGKSPRLPATPLRRCRPSGFARLEPVFASGHDLVPHGGQRRPKRYRQTGGVAFAPGGADALRRRFANRTRLGRRSHAPDQQRLDPAALGKQDHRTRWPWHAGSKVTATRDIAPPRPESLISFRSPEKYPSGQTERIISGGMNRRRWPSLGVIPDRSSPFSCSSARITRGGYAVAGPQA
jgi:hypothetical protein